LAGFEVEAFALPRARAAHAGPGGVGLPGPAAPPPDSARRPPPVEPQNPRRKAPVTPEEAIQQHWDARDQSADVLARAASPQECADRGAIRAMHGGRPPAAKPALPVASATAPRNGADVPARAPATEDPHGVFDRMAASLSYANTFDAGDVRVLRRFDE